MNTRTTRRDLGVKPGESNPARMLALVLVMVAAFAMLGLAAVVAAGWL